MQTLPSSRAYDLGTDVHLIALPLDTGSTYSRSGTGGPLWLTRREGPKGML